MRLLHVLNELRESGAEVMLKVAGSVWQDHGFELHVVSIAPRLGSFAKALTAAGYSIHHHSLDVRSLASFRRLLLEGSFDVVHVHPEYANFWVCSAARSVGVQTIVRSVHSMFDFTGGLRVERVAQRWLLRRLGVKMVSVGRSVQENERARFHNPTIYIPNWIDTELFRPMSAHERHKTRQRLDLGCGPVMVSVGNCAPVKNHPMLLRALAELYGDSDWTYLHIGAEDEGSPERELARHLGLDAHVRFLGRKEPVETADLVRAGDIFLMPSRYEGASVAAIEGLSAGLIPVLTDVPGLRDLKGIATRALWAQPTLPSLTRAIQSAVRLAKTASEADRRQSHQTVRERFSVEDGARRYAALYDGVPDQTDGLPSP